MIKMIVTDLDGTLLNKNEKVSEESKKYLKKLKDMGYIIVIATGRIYASALKATDGAEFANFLITDAGACLYDLSNSKTIFKNGIDKKTVKKLLSYYNNNFRYITICCKNNMYKYSDEIENSNIIKTIKDEEFILNNAEDVFHIPIAMKNNEGVIKLYHRLLNDIKEIDFDIMQDSFSDKKWIVASAKNVSKYNTINYLSSSLNIDNKDIICFGDGLNDIDMLENFCGVAMQNALTDVKNVAHDVTTYDNNHDGVINYLKEHLDVK